MKLKTNHTIVHVGTYPPRECGIATYTRDLTSALDLKFNPEIRSKITAMNDSTNFYNYKKNVRFQIDQANKLDYIRIAKEINHDPKVRLVHLQHEYGIYGGIKGNFVLPFLENLEKPKIVTLHTVLPNIRNRMKRLLIDIIDRSDAVIVMSELSRHTLEKSFLVNQSKIHVIPHGVPQVAYVSTNQAKKKLGLTGKIVLSTFGMINPNKGIEYAISSLPKVIKKFPNIVYLIIGATHPIVRKHAGEEYRNKLKSQVKKLGLQGFVKFYNKYISLNEIIDYLQASDIYISPSLDEYQTVSGTLSYALGCGRPVISTPSVYAREIVSSSIGRLVKFHDPISISSAIISLLSNTKNLIEMSQTAYAKTRHMTWVNIAAAHFEVYQKYSRLEKFEVKFPKIKLNHLRRLSDDFGVWQFAKFIYPDKKYGYTLDDNARALIVSCMYFSHNPNNYILDMIDSYLSFIKFCQRDDGWFYNFINSQRRFDDEAKGEDSLGRALWALGFCSSKQFLPKSIRKRAQKMFERSLHQIEKIESLRARSFATIGLYYFSFSQKAQKKKSIQIIKNFADHQVTLFSAIRSRKWKWFENKLTYSNSKLVDTLFYAYLSTGFKRYLTVARESLRFLREVTLSKDYFSPIGQNGWYIRGGKRSYFDQQPEDASSMVATLLLAYKITKDKEYKEDAYRVFQWFLGKNYLRQMIYDEVTGGCFDGLGKFSVNLNQGAESTISHLLARLSLENTT